MNDTNVLLYLARRAVLLVAIGILGGMGTSLYAQSDPTASLPDARPEWQLILGGQETADWPQERPSAPLDSVQAVSERVVNQFRRNGYYYARLDSATIDTSTTAPEVRLYMRRGPQVTIDHLEIAGADAVPLAEVRRLMDTEKGTVLDRQRLDADIQALLDRYEEIGRPLAQIRVDETIVDSTSPPSLHLTLAIEEGPQLWLQRVEAPERARTSSGLLARLAGLTVGAPLTDYEPEEIRTALEKHPFFTSVDPPTLKVTPDGGAILHIPLEESSPGAFDAILGYLPPSNTRESGQIVGSGQLSLQHLFGGGREVDVTLERRPAQSSVLDLSLSDPYIFGLPLRLTGQFRGEQRDSTYGERTYGLHVGYQFNRAFELTGRLSRKVVNPGQAGTRLKGNRQKIPRARALFYGVGIRYESIDRRFNPRRGLKVDAYIDRGRKRHILRRVTAGGDTVRAQESLPQERFQGTVRAFIPLFNRQVIVFGGDGSVLRSRSYNRSDLFRFGGATTLRGYNEDRFLGNVTVRGLLEYRIQLDRHSYAYAFGDLGYVDRPALGGTREMQAWHPGYGLGIQLSTRIGRITTTYALNPEVATPADGRLHFGLSVGL